MANFGRIFWLSACFYLSKTVSSDAACPASDPDCSPDSASLLQSQVQSHRKLSRYTPLNVEGKSIYFMVVDSFGGPPTGQSYSAKCSGNGGVGWCNGTIKGVTNNLDYIQDMGFDCIWITPVLKQFYGPDPDGRSGYGNYGYWAYNWYEIDESFGTKEDLKELSNELHKRGMCFVYDMVVNHCGPVHSEAMVHQIYPFNETKYFHQRGRPANMSFNEYSKGYAYNGTGYPPPVQAIGPGAMCERDLPDGCSNYKCPYDMGFGQPCNVTPTYIADAPGPPSIPYCGVGDLVCPGYNEQQTHEGWFYDLGDLNQTDPFVHDELIKWGKYMVETYNVDAIRLDTAPYVTQEFLGDFQTAVGVPILGEVTAWNYTFFKSYAPSDGTVLKGLLNFYLQNSATPAFCGNFFPGATLNLTRLGVDTETLLQENNLYNHDYLGNFVDNHDMNRLASYCSSNMNRMKNAIAWTMFTKGMPIIYYGTELFLTEVHPPFWPYNYSERTPGFRFLKALNKVRKNYKVATTGMQVRGAAENHFVFSRACGGKGNVWIFVNNNEDSSTPITYSAAPGRKFTNKERCWVNALNKKEVIVIKDGKLKAKDSEPKILVHTWCYWMFYHKEKTKMMSHLYQRYKEDSSDSNFFELDLEDDFFQEETE
eukprot:TRINITY_DN10563_c1_g2_i1.p1 TRINITY_DN10563_c1_g2~~TRINITY_DN10563_c1_g2_i1.p1  ORF type:complete len:649 (-),score=85.45 TRINITY_DN10563_c1_g2_i1:297-2243(-)